MLRPEAIIAVAITTAVSFHNAVQKLDAAAESMNLATTAAPAVEMSLLTCGVDMVGEGVPLFPVPLDVGLQNYIIQLCDAHNIEPELVFAVIEHESDYNPAATGDEGNSHGLLQIQPRWHGERMARLGCTDLFDPWQNVTVGVDLLAELIEKHETVSMALMVYNAGPTGADTYWFSKGIFSTDYSRTVLSIAERLKGARTWHEF